MSTFTEGYDPNSPLPSYAELVAGVHGGPSGTSWGVFGVDDEVGAMNLLTDERTAAAAALVTRGARFGLTLDLTTPNPPMFGRKPFEHNLFHGDSVSSDDSYNGFYPQASSQWDALNHIAHPELGFYNGVTLEQLGPGGRLGIDKWAAKGIAARFVLLDIAGYFESIGEPLRLGERQAFGVDVLDAACVRQGVEITPGTIVLIYTGWLEWYAGQSREVREEMASIWPSDNFADDMTSMPSTPGLASDASVAAWLWDHGVPAAAADNPGLEALPFSRATIDGWLHYRLIPMLGIAIGELWKLDELAHDCRADGRWEGLLVAAPLNVPGGAGSPTNAVAIK